MRATVTLFVACLALVAGAPSATADTLDFEEFPDSFSTAAFDGSYGGIDWGTGLWQHYAPYPEGWYLPNGVNAIYGAYPAQPNPVSFSFEDGGRVFEGASFNGAVSQTLQYLLYSGDTLVHTSAEFELTALDPMSFYESGYSGVVDRVEIHSEVPSYWIMDDVTFSAVPEPATAILCAAALLAGAGVRRLRRGRSAQVR
jgi:hypothetical protein